MYSRSRVGNVWLLGRWKLELPGGMCLLGSAERKPPAFGSGEKENGLPEKDDPAVSVNALDRDVVLCEFVCL